MGQFSVKTYNPPGSLLSATQHSTPNQCRHVRPHSANDKAGGSCHRLGRTHPDLCNVADRRRVVVVAAATTDPSLSYFEHFGI
jgi:hypothetical protein